MDPNDPNLSSKVFTNDSLARLLEQAKLVLDLTDLMFVALDTNGDVIFANRKACEVLEFQYEEILGKDWFANFVPEHQREEVSQVYEVLMRGEMGLAKYYENFVVTRTGKEKNITWHNTILRDDTNSIIGILSSGEDISSKGHVLKSFETSEEWFKTIFDESPVAINVFDAEGNLINANSAILELSGVKSKTDLSGFNLFDDPNFSDEMKIKAKNGEKIRYRSSIDFEKVKELGLYPTNKNGITYVESAISPIVSKTDGSIRGYVVQLLDITQRRNAEQALLENEERYRTLFESSHDAVLLLKEHKFIECNSKALELFGAPREDLLQKTPFHPDFSPEVQPDGRLSKEKAQELLEKAFSGEPQSFEWFHRRPDGSEFIAEINLTRVEMQGEIWIQGIARDITEQKEAMKTLEQSEAQYRELISLLPPGLVIGDLDENILLANEGMANILDVPKDELMESNLLEYIHKEDRKRLVSQTSQRKEGVVSAYDIRMVTKESEERIVNVHAAPKRNIDGEVDGSVGIFIDITNEKLMEEALERERATLKAITDSSADAIIMIDSDAKITYWNPAAEIMFGYSVDEIIGQHMHSTIIPPENQEAFIYGMRAFSDPTQKSTSSTHHRFPALKKDGSIFHTEVAIAPLLTASGRGAVASIRDISERVRIEKIKQEQHQELELYASLLRHDLRNDLGVILGNVDIARMITSEEDQEMRDLLTSTEAICERMTNLLRALGRRTEEVETKIVEIVRKAASQAQEAEANLTIKMNVPEEAEDYEVPSSRLLPMVFENLFRNAAVHAGKKPVVNITISRKENSIEITVSDNGPGIDESIRSRLFQKGVSTRGGGGLGLYLSREITKALGGTIELMDNESGKGASFRVLLPQSI